MISVVGVACARTLIPVMISPMLLVYGSMYGIPQVAPLMAQLQTFALLMLIACVALAWILSCAGLSLKWLGVKRLQGQAKAKQCSESAMKRTGAPDAA